MLSKQPTNKTINTLNNQLSGNIPKFIGGLNSEETTNGYQIMATFKQLENMARKCSLATNQLLSCNIVFSFPKIHGYA